MKARERKGGLNLTLHLAPWHWWHTAALMLVVVVGALIALFPANAASFGGRFAVDGPNALYLRSGLVGFSLWVAFVIRGHPWWHTLVCLLLSAFGMGQIMRAVYSPDVSGIPWALMWAYLAMMVYLTMLTWRPSVYAQLDSALAELARLRGKR